MASTASTKDIERWKAAGGKVEAASKGAKGGKDMFVSSTGEKFKSWKEAELKLKEGDKEVTVGAKRGKENATGAKAEKKPRAEAKPKAKEVPKKEAKEKEEEEVVEEAEGCPSSPANKKAKTETGSEAEATEGGLVRRAAAHKGTYKESSKVRESKNDIIIKVEDVVCDSEAVGLEQTGGKSSIKRRLLDFSVEDASGQQVAVERIHLMKEDVFVSGLIYPELGELAKVKSQARRVAKIGPIKEWKVLYSSTCAQVQIKTAHALYDLVKPASGYRKIHSQLEEQLGICAQVYLALCPDVGGSMKASYDEVVAKLARSKIGKSYGSTRDALVLSAKFVLSQLEAMTVQVTGTSTTGKSTISFRDSPFGRTLAEEASKNAFTSSLMSGSGGIMIADGGAAGDAAAARGDDDAPKDSLVEADEEMARRLQAKLDAEQYGGGAGGRGRGAGRPQVAPYIRISEEEIADDYPLPAQYSKEEEEMDELLMMEEEMMDCDPEYLPKRLLHNFAIYNAEGFFSTLELVPMFSGADHDIDMFASGVVAEDEGDWCVGGQALEGKTEGDEGGSGGGSGAGGTAAATVAVGGMRLFLSQIREWVVECSCDLLFISIRTDVAWYRLVNPDTRYAPWFKTVLKSAQLAMKIISMLSAECRASRLSFGDIVKRLTELQPEDSTFVSKKAERVERFVVVHGQIILNQFKHYPNKAVQKAAFVGELKQRMEVRKHSKLYFSKKGAFKASLAGKVRTANPMKNRAATGLKAKPMPATATTMVKSVWHGYFFGAKGAAKVEETEEGAADGTAQAPLAKEVEEADVNEEEEEEEVAVEARAAAAAAAKSKAKKAAQAAKKARSDVKPTWVGKALSTDATGRTLYSAAKVGGLELTLGQVVELDAEDEEDEAEDGVNNAAGGCGPLGLVLALFQDKKGGMFAQLRVMVAGPDSVLGDAGSECELFVTEETVVAALPSVLALRTARRLQRTWDHKLRAAHFKEDDEFRKKNAELRAAGKPMEYVYKHLYRPELGMFCTIPEELLATGAFHEAPKEPIAFGLIGTGGEEGFIKAGKEYKIGDFMYLHPATFETAASSVDEVTNVPAYARKGGKHKGSNAGLRAYAIAQLLAVVPPKGSNASSATLMVRRFWRPEDISREQAYKADWQDVYASPAAQSAAAVEVEDVEGGCSVLLSGKGRDRNDVNVFVCRGTVDAATAPTKVLSPPKSLAVSEKDSADALTNSVPLLKAMAAKAKAAKAAGGKRRAKKGDSDDEESDVEAEEEVKAAKPKAAPKPSAKDKGKGKVVASASEGKQDADEEMAEAGQAVEDEEAEQEEKSLVALASMDIFAGCGGLSEGMHQAGVAEAKWAIEYEAPAADAFQLNNPDAKVFCNNCNVLLHAAMEKAGLVDDCDACDDCMEASAKLTPETKAALPLPGEVEFMMGGPPCQGYSGMNRFNHGNWSLVQNSMVMAYLSFCDFYRPRYFLLENVRNFVSHNKSFTFRLTLRTLLEMGYQVRFGVLNAGLYGVPQSRKRTIIWAAAPGDSLPNWPSPMHVFQTPQLTINLPGGVQYTAVPNQAGAPRRAVTVRDAIAELPPIENGHDVEEMQYSGPPQSAFQASIRGRAKALKDHNCKAMNELNLERCRCIPKNQPGADWRVLQEIVAADPSREKYKGQPLVPWCLPNTADRHNGWRGLFGRLDLNGHFPTSTTDPQPMGKVGQVFHPTQDRIVSVRECARSQGFPDHHLFSGNVHNRHRQVGNAVPPPLAHALGRQLRKILDAKREKEVQDSLAAQLGL